MEELPEYLKICERYAQKAERRIKEKGLTEEEWVQKREEYEAQFNKKKEKKVEKETEEKETKDWWKD